MTTPTFLRAGNTDKNGRSNSDQTPFLLYSTKESKKFLTSERAALDGPRVLLLTALTVADAAERSELERNIFREEMENNFYFKRALKKSF